MKMTAFAVMSLILFSNCSSNRMGIFDCFRKKKDNVATTQQTQDTFTVFSIEGDSLPCVGSINNRFANNKEWKDILTDSESIIREYLQKGKYRKELKARQGLAIGFVDGDLVLL